MKRIVQLECFWQSVLCAAFALATYASGSYWASGFIAAIAMFFAIDVAAQIWPKYIKRLQDQSR
jgi:hypothetical protein